MTTTISHETIEELHQKLIAAVQQLGYRVTLLAPHPEKLTLDQVAERCGRSKSTVSRSLKRAERAGNLPPFRCGRGASGRILWLEPTEQLIEFLTLSK